MDNRPESVLREFFHNCFISRDRKACLALSNEKFMFICPDVDKTAADWDSSLDLLENYVNKNIPHGFEMTDVHERDIGFAWLVYCHLSARADTFNDNDVIVGAVLTANSPTPRVMMLHCATDESKKLMRTESKLAKEKEMMTFALNKAGASCWEYDAVNDRVAAICENDNCVSNPSPAESPAEYYIREGYINPRSEETLRALYKRICAGEKDGTADISVLTADSRRWTNRRVYFHTDFDKDGRPLRALCVEKNIDDIVYANARYEEVLRQYNSLERDCLFNWRVDLTHMRVEYSHDRGDLELKAASIDVFLPENLEAMSLHLPVSQRPMFIQLLTPSHMYDDYVRGRRYKQLEFQWTSKRGDSLWVSVNILTVANPQKGSVIAFLHVRDISGAKFWERALSVGTEMICDFIAVIDTVSGSVRRLNDNASGLFVPGLVPCDYDRALRRFIKTLISEPERERAYEYMRLDSIISALDSTGMYSNRCGIMTASGDVEIKEWLYRYLDEGKHSILYVRRGVTKA